MEKQREFQDFLKCWLISNKELGKEAGGRHSGPQFCEKMQALHQMLCVIEGVTGKEWGDEERK